MNFTSPTKQITDRYIRSENRKEEALQLANLIGHIIYLYADGSMVAAGSDLAREKFDSGQRLIFVARPR